MNSDQIITLVSVCISGLSVLTTALLVIYQINRGQAFEREKIKLEVYSLFISYCKKKAAGVSTSDDDFEFVKIHSKLCLITDHKLNKNTEKLYNSLLRNPRSAETIHLLDEETQQMWLRLKDFNRRFGRRFPRF